MTETDASQAWRDIHFSCRDGLRLYARHYPAPGSIRRPVICLAGLTRNTRDFHRLALELFDPRGHRRDVYCLDMRGRGRSEHDPDWKNYTPLIEALDVLDFMTLQGLHDTAIIGTSRGGLLAMIIALMRPAALGAVVLNDIGPVIERNGLARIAGYVGRMPLPPSWPEAAARVRDIMKRQFTGIRDEEWLELARTWYNDENGLPSPSYDAAIANSIRIADIGSDLPEMWEQFAALSRIPLMVIRGESSDLLSPATVQRMARAHPSLVSHVVPKQGHAPLLRDAPTIGVIADFLAQADSRRTHHGKPTDAAGPRAA
jgi:pimeloyl-ACP methyl ester carboxylesterase